MKAYPAYTVEMVDALPLQTFTALGQAAQHDRRQRVLEVMEAMLLANAKPDDRQRVLARWEYEE
jgi:hypothetical protein